MRSATATPPPPSAGTIERTWRATARSGSRSAPAVGAAMSAKIDVAIASRMRGSPSLGRQCFECLWRGEHLARVVSYAGQFDHSPVESPTALLRQHLRRIEYVYSALVARVPLGQRRGRVVSLIVAGIALAEIDRQRLFQISPQRGLAIRL